MKHFLFLSMLLVSTGLAAQDKVVTYYSDGAANPPSVSVILKHIKAEISFMPEENLVKGITEFTFYPCLAETDSIVFSTPDFKISSVSIGTVPASFHINGPDLIIFPGKGRLKYHKEDIIKIEYEARPLKGSIYFVGWRPEEQGKRKVIWSHRPMGWLPYIDARITMDMYYTFDGRYKVFANGERISVKENKNGTKTWNYRMDKNHPFFSTSLVIGDYDYSVSSSKSGVPLEYWYYKGEEAKVASTYMYTEAMMDFFGNELDFKYPYPVYRQAPVIDYMYGAMETTTATVFGDFMLEDPHAFWQRNYINTNAHEMAHQWFGNYICQLANKDVWLTESFGTYYAKMFEKNQFGEDHYQELMNEEYNTVMQAAKVNNYPVGSSKGGNARIYQKGSLVLGMLRYVMGETEFRYAVNDYLKKHPYMNAQQEDFFRSVYEASGQSYLWFFDEWILHGGEPHYKIEWRPENDATGSQKTIVQVSQIHETNELIGLFTMPVRVEVHYKDGKTADTTIWIKDQFQEIRVPNKEKKLVDFILFDPGRYILKKVTFERSFEELAAQAMKAENMIDRYDALVALRNSSISDKKELLFGCYKKEKFHLTKSEIISQLANDRSDPSIALFREAVADSDALVRKAVLTSVLPAPLSLKPDFEKALNDFSYLNQDLALQNLVISFPSETDKYLDLTKDMKGWRGLNIRMRWLYLSISSGKKEFLPELIDYSSPKYEFETRINSFIFLQKLMYSDEMTISDAKQASLHWNGKLAGAAKDYLKYFNIE